jgi:hypothetical protein
MRAWIRSSQRHQAVDSGDQHGGEYDDDGCDDHVVHALLCACAAAAGKPG